MTGDIEMLKSIDSLLRRIIRSNEKLRIMRKNNAEILLIRDYESGRLVKVMGNGSIIWYFYATPPKVRAVYALRSINNEFLNREHINQFSEFIRRDYAFFCTEASSEQMQHRVEKGDMLASSYGDMFGLITAQTIEDTFKEYFDKIKKIK